MGDDAGSVEKAVTVDMIRDLQQQQQWLSLLAK